MNAGSADAPGAALLVFARAPLPGHCKTRLIPALGAAGAAALQRRLVGHTLATARAAGFAAVQLWCAPDTRHPFFAECAAAGGVSLHAQAEGDLGARMAHAFERALAASHGAILIGSDAPSLDADDLRAARAALAQGCDAVIAPAEDGGYVLIGLARPAPELFADMPWGTPRVMALTAARLAKLGWRTRLLRERWDVDTPADLARLDALAGDRRHAV